MSSVGVVELIDVLAQNRGLLFGHKMIVNEELDG